MSTDAKNYSPTRQEQITKAIELDIDERTTNIWAWVREHRHSLDAERGRRMIREAIAAATESLCKQIAPMLLEIDALKKRLSDVRAKAKTDIDEHAATIKTLQNEAKAARTKYAKAIKEIEELRAKAVDVN